MLNIVIPMAGHGSRFKQAGFALPKPLIPIHGVPMIRLVIHNLTPSIPHRFIFLCLDQHLQDYDLASHLGQWAPDCTIVPVSTVTQGAACTVLLAEKHIDNDHSLMIANCDQWINTNLNDYLAILAEKNTDGLIMTMTANDAKWSFAKMSADGTVCRVAEKEVISDEATVGIYNFKRGSDFVMGAKKMLLANKHVNNEFYVAPVYNELIAEGKKIKLHNIGSLLNGMYGLGIPEDLALFEKLAISQQATADILSVD